MRILGLDLGSKTLGVSVSDALGMMHARWKPSVLKVMIMKPHASRYNHT